MLHARAPEWAPASIDHLLLELQRLQLIADSYDKAQTDALRAGERFLSLIMFLGCSPHIELDLETAPRGTAVCTVRVHLQDQVTFHSAARRVSPRCAQCRAAIDDPDVADHRAGYRCPSCGHAGESAGLDWRRAAGFARCFIEVTAIHPHEAVPSDVLLDTLAAHAGGPWTYFYC